MKKNTVIRNRKNGHLGYLERGINSRSRYAYIYDWETRVSYAVRVEEIEKAPKATMESIIESLQKSIQ